MNKYFHTITLSALFFCSFLNVCAQERAISEQEYETLKKNAYEKLKNKNHRVIMTSEGYVNVNDSSPNQFVNEIIEYLAPDRQHSIYERKSGETMYRLETISIGEKKYSKLNNEDWNEVTRIGKGLSGGITGTILDNEVTFERKYKGRKMIENQNVDLYEVITTRKYNLPEYKSVTVITERIWLDKNGMFLKRESESKRDYKKVTNHIIWEYEYDPENIKIEAPIIKSKQKTTEKP